MKHTTILHYLLTMLIMGLSLLIRFAIAPVNAGLQYVVFFPAVTVSALLGGYKTGLFATLIGLVLASYFFTPPYFSFSGTALLNSLWPNLVFLFDGVLVSLSIEGLNRYRSKFAQELMQSKVSEKRFRALFEQMPDPAWLIHNEYFVDANQAALDAMGFSNKPNFLRIHPVNISPEYQPDGQLSAVKAAEAFEIVKQKGIHRFEWMHCRQDGSTFPVEVTLTQIDWDNMSIIYCIWRDITNRKRKDEKLHDAQQLMDSIIDNIPAMVFMKSASDFQFELFNRSGEELLGYPAADILGKNDHDVFPQDQADFFAAGDRQVLASEAIIEFPEAIITTSKGENRYLYTRKVALRDKEGKPKHILGISIDFTERKRAEEELRIAAVTFETDAAIMINDADGNIIKVNKAFQTITGFTHEDVYGKNPRILSSGRHDRQFYADMWQQLLRKGSWAGEIWDRRKNGQIYPKWLTITAIKDSANITTGYVAIFTDITDQKQAEEEIRNLAYFDPLTKLPNRRFLIESVQQALTHSAQTQQHGAVLFLDMDKFKVLNDTQGHEFGDLMLIEVAERIKRVVRNRGIVARLGGDEFVILLENIGKNSKEASEHVIQIAEKIRNALALDYLLQGYIHHTSPSIGVSLYHGNTLSSSELLKHADIAMYQAKNSGRNKVCFYDPEMQQALDVRAMLEYDLRLAVKEQNLQLFYQIQMDNEKNPFGAEALIRWIHPQRGMIPPTHFIPIAEDSSLILDIGSWVLSQACRQLEQWRHNEHTCNLILAINVSANQFRQADFVEMVEKTISAFTFDVTRLKLELTESVIVDNIAEVIAKMHALKASGIRLSLDDFGTGYSSLSYLKQLPLDQIKIDQSFVRDVVADPSDAVLVKTIIDMAKNFRLNVIAEGVETEAQFTFLKENGCMAYQGYLFSKPLPLGQFESLLQSE